MSKPNTGERLIKVFWQNVNKTETCWLWTGAISNSGYGSIKILGKVKKAHIIGYQLQHDDYNERLNVLHKCDTPLCVRGDHLFQGTQATNMNDASRKMRHGMIKMTPEQIIEAKAIYDKGGISLAKLALRYNCTAASLCLLFSGKSRGFNLKNE